MFWKQSEYAREGEFRAVLRPGSVSGEAARHSGAIHVDVTVDTDRLIREVRFFPQNDRTLERNLQELLQSYSINARIGPAEIT